MEKIKREKSTFLREERDRDLFNAYIEAVSSGKCKTEEEAIEYARNHQAKRFYIDSSFCCFIMRRMIKGEPPNVGGQNSIRKFNYLYKLFNEVSSNPKNKGCSTLDICDIILDMPAPEFFVTYRTARFIIARERKVRWEALAKRQHR